MGFDVLDARAEIRVAMGFMIPPVLIGARVGLDRATFANYREARTSFWEDTLMPMHKHIKDTFQRELADEEWTDVYLEWDYQNVPVLFQKNIEQRIQHRADYLAGGLQLNEYRKYMGLGPLPANTGDVRVQSLAFQIIPEGEMGQLVPLKNPVGVGDTKKLQDIIMETKSPACRQEDETEEDCVKRKIPEIAKENPDWDHDQVIAVAYEMCSKECSEKFDWEIEPSLFSGDGKDALPEDAERDEIIAGSIAKVRAVLDAEQERILDAV